MHPVLQKLEKYDKKQEGTGRKSEMEKGKNRKRIRIQKLGLLKNL
jgi:hypothetical protein